MRDIVRLSQDLEFVNNYKKLKKGTGVSSVPENVVNYSENAGVFSGKIYTSCTKTKAKCVYFIAKFPTSQNYKEGIKKWQIR